MARHIVIIDDDATVLDALGDIMGSMGHQVSTFRDPVVGEEYALANDFDLLLLDLHMPDRSGADIAKDVLRKRPDACVLLITGDVADPRVRDAIDSGVRDVVRKPFEIGVVLDYLKNPIGGAG